MRKLILAALTTVMALASVARASTLEEVLSRGELRHIGVPYARFVTGSGDGLDIELIQGFAKFLGVAYRFVQSDWENLVPDLTGEKSKGDLIASGMTMLDWRSQTMEFSSPTFPTQVWILAASETPVVPVTPTGSTSMDIANAKRLVSGRTIMDSKGTCLDPDLYGLREAGASLIEFKGDFMDRVPALIQGFSDLALLDVPDILIALASWPGQIKVIGPVSGKQGMAVAFKPDNGGLREKFEEYYENLRSSGEYRKMVERYYPSVFQYFPEFLDERP